jgi:hypothetical protein
LLATILVQTFFKATQIKSSSRRTPGSIVISRAGL